MTKQKVHVMESDENIYKHTPYMYAKLPTHTQYILSLCVLVMFQLGIPKREAKMIKS